MNKIIILLIILLVNFSPISNLFKVNEVVLEDVKLKESEPSSRGFALMLQQDDGTYEQSNSNTWPNGMEFNNELSRCIDVNGNIIEGALDYDSTTNLMNISVSESARCYVFFDKSNSLSNYLIDNVSSTELWNSTLEDDGYRYVGTNPNNYVCFGTTDKNVCLNDTDKYMYRIIGIFEDGGNKYVKLIKKEALNTIYAWNSDYQTDTDWNNCDLYNGINGNYFLTNTNYSYMQDAIWTNKIATWTYTMTNTKTWKNYDSTGTYGPYYNDNTNKVLYLHELNKSGKSNEICYYESGIVADCNVGEWKTLTTKISLMYASDYALSLGEIALDYIGTNNYSTMKTGWMHISNNDSGAPSSYEWTMSRLGHYSNGIYSLWTIRSDGLIDWYYVSNSFATRPVFYLESDVEYLDGMGSITEPFIITY